MKIVGIVITVIGALFAAMQYSDEEMKNAVAVFMVIAFSGFMLFSYSSIKQSVKDSVESEEDEFPFSYAVHMSGLPIAPGIVCGIFIKDTQVIFNDDATDFRLNLNKIRDVSIKTETEIRNAYVSSIGGAIGGAALFGTLGAIIGGRAKKKTDKTVNSFLIFTYVKKDGNVDYISFDITRHMKDAIKVKVAAKNMIQSPSSVEL